MSVKDKFNIFEKMYDILMILVDFCGNFPRFQAIFCYPDPADQNMKRIQTDPDPQHCKL